MLVTDMMGHSLAFGTAFVAIALWIAHVDVKHQRIPDIASATLAVTGGLWVISSHGAPQLFVHMSGAIASAGVLYGLRAYYLKARSLHALGLGDVKLIAAIGLWLTPLQLPWLLLASSASALVAVGSLAIVQNGWPSRRRLPFGPFLAFSGFAVWHWGGPHQWV